MSRLEESELEDIWSCISTNQQHSAFPSLKNSEKGHQLSQLVTDYFRTGSFLSLEQCTSLSPEERAQVVQFLRDKIAKQQLDIDWKISVVVGNNYTHKSLHPIAQVTVDDQQYELDMDGVASMRLELAKALQATNKYEKDE